jgi:ATP-dependent exoDNAse (exonuclease V) beta subunit
VIDLAFREDDATWVVVDFKTDDGLTTTKATSTYVTQLRRYARGIREATKLSVKAFLLGV